MKDLSELEKYRLRDVEKDVYGTKGDGGNGVFKVYVFGKSFFVIASNGGGWEHISVSPCNKKRCPTWEEMCEIKSMFFRDDECCVEYHPKKSEYVNMHPYCLHIWKPTKDVMPTPPSIMV